MRKKVASVAVAAILSTTITTNAFASTYTVKKGDTLTSIARQHNTSIAQIKSLNGLKTDALFINQHLKLTSSAPAKNTAPAPPAKSPVPAPPATNVKNQIHTVTKGDSLSKIALTYKVTIAEIKVLNQLKSDTIYVGQTLKITGAKPNGQSNQTVESTVTPDKNPAEQKPVLPTQNQPGTAGTALKDFPQIVDNLLLSEAVKLVGTPYVFGGSTVEGFDCSGFIHYVFTQAGMKINRLSSDGYHSRAYYIDSPQPGDLVFFENTYKEGISHLGIYLGDNKFIHASTTAGVEITDLTNAYYQKHFEGFKRFY